MNPPEKGFQKGPLPVASLSSRATTSAGEGWASTASRSLAA